MKIRTIEGVLTGVGLGLMFLGIGAHIRVLDAATATQVAKAAPVTSAPRAFAITGVRVFDGARVIERATVVVDDGRIGAVGPDVAVPRGMTTIDGTGRTLLPGLIDAHTHVFTDALERAIVFGVTTELDMFTDHALAARMRGEQHRGLVASRADLLSAGTLATAPGGHGTEYGIAIPTIARAADAQAFVDARIAEGSDYIKIIYDDGAGLGYRFPSLDRATLQALVEAAHRRGKLVIVHVATRQAARDALDAGADGLAHVFADQPADGLFITLARARGAFVVPTLTVISSTASRAGDAKRLLTDPALAPFVSASERRTLGAEFPLKGGAHADFAAARRTVSMMKAAGIPLLAGTDAPNPGTAHGISLHHELELLVDAGLSPVEALSAATSVPARVFGLSDRGRIAPGLRADIVLVDGDPTREIAATRRIVSIWKGGVLVDRRPAATDTARAAEVVTDGLVSDFDDDIRARFGAGWIVSTDKLMGGASEASMRRAEGGARASKGSLEISGTMAAGSPYPWAGAMFFPGSQPMAAADVSRFTYITFWARGDAGVFRVLAFATHLGNIPVEQPFTVGAEWREYSLPLASFGNMDGKDLRAVLISAGSGQGRFRLQIDEVGFR